jgi:hypothetical protein
MNPFVDPPPTIERKSEETMTIIHATTMHTFTLTVCPTCFGVMGTTTILYLAVPLAKPRRDSTMTFPSHVTTLTAAFHPDYYCDCLPEEEEK